MYICEIRQEVGVLTRHNGACNWGAHNKEKNIWINEMSLKEPLGYVNISIKTQYF